MVFLLHSIAERVVVSAPRRLSWPLCNAKSNSAHVWQDKLFVSLESSSFALSLPALSPLSFSPTYRGPLVSPLLTICLKAARFPFLPSAAQNADSGVCEMPSEINPPFFNIAILCSSCLPVTARYLPWLQRQRRSKRDVSSRVVTSDGV